MRRYINEGIAEFLGRSSLSWHMPGHKRKNGFTPQTGIVDDALEKLHNMDVTEVPGTDDLYVPEGMILSSMEELKKIYKSRQSFYLVNGATAGNFAALYAVRQYAGRTVLGSGNNKKIILAGNCHKSVYNAADVLQLEAVTVMPERYMFGFEHDTSAGAIYGHVSADAVREICESENIFAMVVTSPTYEGVRSDIGAIADVLHEYGAILIVDEAHGAHLPFIGEDMGCASALGCGADIVVHSLHKNLPAMTQTALLHVMREDLISDVREGISVFMSSSPSYVMLCSMENAVAYMCEGDFRHYRNALFDFRKAAGTLKSLHVLEPEEVCGRGAFSYDSTRIVITANIKNFSGKRLADILVREYNIVVEMSGISHVVLISTVADSSHDFETLLAALIDLDKRITDTGMDGCLTGDAENTHGAVLDGLCGMAGTAAKNHIYVYPPGNYIVRRGEIITKEQVEEIAGYINAGIYVRGLL